MLYTIIDIYEVMRTDEVYPQFADADSVSEDGERQKSDMICTDPYKFLQ